MFSVAIFGINVTVPLSDVFSTSAMPMHDPPIPSTLAVQPAAARLLD